MFLHDLVRNQAEKHPDHIAVTYKNLHTPYGQLESESNRLAVLLRRSGVEAGDRIGLLMERSPEMIVAILGISKVGGISVPLDSVRSARKLNRLVRLSGIRLIMVDETRTGIMTSWSNLRKPTEGIPWCWWSTCERPDVCQSSPWFTMTDIDDQTDLPLNPRPVRESDITHAQLLFQPNRLGFPSPLAVTHREVTSFAEWSRGYFGMRREDRIAGWSPLSMGLSLLDLFGTFAAGAHLYIPQTQLYPNGRELSGFILENDITQWSSPPAVFHALASEKAIGRTGYPGLERLIWWGDQILEPVLHYWMQHLPRAGFTRLFTPDKRGLATNYQTIHALSGAVNESDTVESDHSDGDEEMGAFWSPYRHVSVQNPVTDTSPGSDPLQDALNMGHLSGPLSEPGHGRESAGQAGIEECLAVGPDGTIRHQQIIRSGQNRFLFEQGQIFP